MKISIVGAGNVGGLTAMLIAQERLGDVLFIDVLLQKAKAKALDLEDSQSLLGRSYSIEATDNMDKIKDSHLIVITAGLPRKPGMNREELLNCNLGILKDVCAPIKKLAKQAIVIVVTNPLDIMTYYAVKALGFKTNRVFGMGVSLDASRFTNLISKDLGVATTDIQSLVIASHGEEMLPLPRFTLARNKPLTEFLSREKINELVIKTVQRGKEIVSLLGSGSAYFAPSAAIMQIVKAVVRDEKIKIGVSAYLNGEYGIEDICMGVPCIIGKEGIEEIVELDLNSEEKEKFLSSAESIRKLANLLAVS